MDTQKFKIQKFKIQNSKLKTQNSKQISNLKIQNTKLIKHSNHTEKVINWPHLHCLWSMLRPLAGLSRPWTNRHQMQR